MEAYSSAPKKTFKSFKVCLAKVIAMTTLLWKNFFWNFKAGNVLWYYILQSFDELKEAIGKKYIKILQREKKN